MGFFQGKSKELESQVRLTGCASCGLASGCLHPKMEPSGHGRKRILIVAEAPGEDEDRLGTQLIGRVGQFLRATLKTLNIDLDRDCRKTNSVRCRPPGNREPEPREKSACRKHLFDEIARSKPNVIIPLGGHGLWSLLEGRWKRDNHFGITRWRGLTIPDHELGAWVCPTFHPSYVQRNQDIPATEIIWRRDLERAIGLVNEPLPTKPDPNINFLDERQIGPFLLSIWKSSQASNNLPHVGLKPGTQEWMECWKKFPKNQQEMIEYMKNPTLCQQGNTIAFDYETTGLKPYREGHEIICCSVATNPKEVSVWMWRDMDGEATALYKSVMQNLNIRKIAGNMKFEQVWTRQILGHDVKRWYWDTVIAAKSLDYRLGNSSVKFQAYSRLGVLGYDESIDPYIRSANNDPNGFNRMKEVSKKELLEYCAWDSVLEYHIAMKQMEEINRS